MKKAMRITALLLALLMIVGALAGCASNTTSTDDRLNNLDYDESKYPLYETTDGYKFWTEPETLTVWCNFPGGMNIGWGDDEVSAWITDTIGITLDSTYATTASGEELSAMIIAGMDLEDMLIVDPNSAVARQLVEFEYVLPLNKLADDYYEDFNEIIPPTLKDTYAANDGNLYHTVAWYGDAQDIQAVREKYNLTPGAGDQSLCLNREYYEKMGEPEIKTPDDLYQYLVDAKKKYPDVGLPIIPYYVSWDQTKDAVNLFYRMYGGQDWLYADKDGKIQICIDDPRYKSALQMMNKMYRAGLFTQEALAGDYNIITTNLRSKNCFAYIGQDWQWFSLLRDGDQLGSPCLPIQIPVAEGETLKLKDLQKSSLGSGAGMYVSADSPIRIQKRAIEYLAFRYTEESQIAERFGLEGHSWERNPNDGMISWTKEVKDFEAENGWQAGSEKWGYNCQTHSYFVTQAVCAYESLETLYPIQKYNNEIHGSYVTDERVYDLCKRITDPEMKAKYEDFVKMANECIARCLQADSEAKFAEEYDYYVSMMKQTNQDLLEDYLTKSYEKWSKVA